MCYLFFNPLLFYGCNVVSFFLKLDPFYQVLLIFVIVVVVVEVFGLDYVKTWELVLHGMVHGLTT
jgi:hypothetical protein